MVSETLDRGLIVVNRRQKIKEAVYRVNAIRKAVKDEAQRIRDERAKGETKEETPKP